MKKLIIGLVLILVGIVSCTGGSILAVAPIATQAIDAPLVAAGGTLQVDAAQQFTLLLDTSGDVRSAPSGTYGFLDADGRLIELTRATDLGMEQPGMVALGTAQLGPGTYTIQAPEQDPPLQFKVLSFDPESVAAVIFISCGLGGLFGVVGLIVVILGIVQMSRDKKSRRNVHDDDEEE